MICTFQVRIGVINGRCIGLGKVWTKMDGCCMVVRIGSSLNYMVGLNGLN